jgi:serine/threonine protein kinase
LLTAKLPFETQDSLELIYSHLAKTAIPPHLIVKDSLPQVVSDIVMKLMAKTAEERYQSAWGIKADLIDINPKRMLLLISEMLFLVLLNM